MPAHVPSVLSRVKLSPSRVAKNAAAIGTAMVLGDLGCQMMESWDGENRFSWDHKRTLRMGITGVFVVTPMSYSWNMLAERLSPGTSWKAIFKKMGVGTAAMPPMIIAQFTSLTLLEEGKTMDDVRQRLSQDFVPTLKAGLCYWPAVGILSARFVSVVNRPAAGSLAGFFWNIYLSHRANHRGLELGQVYVRYPLEATMVAATASDGPNPSTTSALAGVSGAVTMSETRITGTVMSEVAPVANAGQEAKKGGGVQGTPTIGRPQRSRTLVRRTTVVSM